MGSRFPRSALGAFTAIAVLSRLRPFTTPSTAAPAAAAVLAFAFLAGDLAHGTRLQARLLG